MALKASTARVEVASEQITAREPTDADTATAVVTPFPAVDGAQKDYFVKRDGLVFAGTHLLVELWDATNLDSIEKIDAALRDSVETCGATLLNMYLHHFGPECGVSGVAVLAESHISIHTWPERGYAAVDLFMCGACDPHKAVAVMKAAFKPGSVQLSEHKRGLVG